MKFPIVAIAALLLVVRPATSQLGLNDEGDVKVNPDPHFRTWDDTYYDYHGGCDLVLIHNALLDLHIRTVPTGGYSYISHAAVRIGGDTLEVRGDGSDYYVDYVLQSTAPATIGGYPFTLTSTATTTTYELTLNNGQYIRFEKWGPPSSLSSLSVYVHGHGSDFSDSVGMGGMWSLPGLIGRDFQDYSSNTTELALTWQVASSSDPILFIDPGVATCLPPGTFSGCLRDQEGNCDEEICKKCVGADEVEAACADVNDPNEKQNCEFDVTMTGNEEWGLAPFYKPPPPPQQDRRCKPNKGNLCARRYGGECVWQCRPAHPYYKCLPDLCMEYDEPEPRNLPSSLRALDADENAPCPDCSCRIRTAGYYHNEVLEFLQLGGYPCALLMNATDHEDMLDAAAKFMIDELHTEEDLTKDVLAEITKAVDERLRYTSSQGNEYVHYNDVSSLMHMLRGLHPICRVSQELEAALDRVHFEAQFQEAAIEEERSGGVPRLDDIVRKHVLDVEWHSDFDKEVVASFESVYEASTEFWRDPPVMPPAGARRRPRWITILADAIGGAVGGAVGSAAGGPIGAGIGAGLLGAAVSNVFG